MVSQQQVVSSSYGSMTDEFTKREAIKAAENKDRKMQDFQEEAVFRATKSEIGEDGTQTTTTTTTTTQKSKGQQRPLLCVLFVYISVWIG